MSPSLFFVVALIALTGSASILAMVRIRLRIEQLRTRLENFDARIDGLAAIRNSVTRTELRDEPTRSLGAVHRIDPPEPRFQGPESIAIPNLAGLPSTDRSNAAQISGRLGESFWNDREGMGSEDSARPAGLPNAEAELVLGLRKLANPRDFHREMPEKGGGR